MANIYISYSSNDKEFANKLFKSLEQLGHSSWLDEQKIQVGEHIPSKIQEGLKSADYLIVILSSSSVKSGWVEKEWQAKYWSEVESGKTVVFPVLIEKCDIPPLLKPKKYANFTEDYGAGFVELMAAINPTLKPTETIDLKEEVKTDGEISDLISKIQSRSVSLSQCFAEALSLAIKVKDKNLEDFCRNELVGWANKKINQKSKNAPTYRLVEAFVTPHKINLQYYGWGNASSIFEYMREERKYFFPWKLLINESISEIETKNIGPSTGVMIFQKPHKYFKKDSKTPDTLINVYFHPNAYPQILEAVRNELTRRLLDLLPQISS